MMGKVLAISGTYRKGKTIDTLIDKAIEGLQGTYDDIDVEKIRLIDKDIQYCRNCMVCAGDDPDKPYARCVIDDDMQEIYRKMSEADGFILGTPVNMTAETAVMKAFLERSCFVMGKPGNYPIKGCPEPRSAKRKCALIIVSSGIVFPLMRVLCDRATPLLKDFCNGHLNAAIVGAMYAGGVTRIGVEPYYDEAVRLGKRLGKWVERGMKGEE
ncbi:MAG: flavodoxin family protein [Candidatus Eremiobacteraeota bacterium]|nr:flavodoxin family protein [Candidatus Eremiobacteraeota bacterium]